MPGWHLQVLLLLLPGTTAAQLAVMHHAYR
jgi:hypothetical protein